MPKITTDARVWIPKHVITKYTGSASDILRRVIAGQENLLENSHVFNLDMSSEGWIEVGRATIIADLVLPDSLTAAEVAILNQQIEELDRRHHEARTALLERVSKLQALTFDGGAA